MQPMIRRRPCESKLMEQRFAFDSKLKMATIITFAVGFLLLVIGYFAANGGGPAADSRLWSSLLFSNLFFTWIALIGGFFVAAFGLGYSGWHTLFKRIPEAMAHYIFFGIPIILLIYLLAKQDIYEWTIPEIVASDGLIQFKGWWLSNKMYIGFTLFWFLTMGGAFYLLRRNSVRLDQTGDYKLFNKSFVIAALFCFFFAIMNSVSTWHWVMSTEPHWYSTLYGWYLFASALVTGFAVMILMLLFLKGRGYLPRLNTSHIHDLGKFLFAFSVFWTYLWFSQHMLIWYANIPEETIHYEYKYANHKFTFFLVLIMNFFIPLLVLMSRDAKRNFSTLIVVACVIIIGHWLDFFLMIRPGTDRLAGHKIHEAVVQHIGLMEVGAFLFFGGLFTYVTFSALASANLTPMNHPFEQESVEHHI